MEHQSVLIDEVLNFFEYLNSKEEKIIADFTIGGGGHSEAILSKFNNVKILGFDKDSFAIDYAKNRLKQFKNRVEFIKSDFADFDKFINCKLDGALVDLGISSFHIDIKERGFSFDSDAKLNMRMDSNSDISAYEVINTFDFLTLQKIFKNYGEIKMPNRVINAIISARKLKPIETCRELAEIINKNYFTKNKKINPATKFFQAIRIYVNNELKSLETFLLKIFDFLNKGARLQIISFHSLEDRIVKKAFKYETLSCICPKDSLICNCNKVKKIKIITKKPITPKQEEINFNRRSRSAKLRVAEKIV